MVRAPHSNYRHSFFNVLLKSLQVFEANIRLLGGLLSAHLLMEEKGGPFEDYSPDWYSLNSAGVEVVGKIQFKENSKNSIVKNCLD